MCRHSSSPNFLANTTLGLVAEIESSWNLCLLALIFRLFSNSFILSASFAVIIAKVSFELGVYNMTGMGTGRGKLGVKEIRANWPLEGRVRKQVRGNF